jgi:hypothetical protein
MNVTVGDEKQQHAATRKGNPGNKRKQNQEKQKPTKQNNCEQA